MTGQHRAEFIRVDNAAKVEVGAPRAKPRPGASPAPT
jgi:hypothetical protein